MTSPLCWGASTNVLHAQDQASTSSNVKSSPTRAKHRHPQGKGAAHAWLPLHSKAGPLHTGGGTSTVNAQVAELQKKVQVLGKMARKGTKNQESTVSTQPFDQARCDKGLSPAFIQVTSFWRQKSVLVRGFPHPSYKIFPGPRTSRTVVHTFG